MSRHRFFLIPLFLLGMMTACSVEVSKTLVLSLSADSSGFSISDYQVMDRPFTKSYQQGNYQALLLDSEGNTLRKVTFQDVQHTGSTEDNADLTVSIPLEENLYQVAIFRLDGRSGHYQRTDKSMVTWKLPESVMEEANYSISDR